MQVLFKQAQIFQIFAQPKYTTTFNNLLIRITKYLINLYLSVKFPTFRMDEEMRSFVVEMEEGIFKKEMMEMMEKVEKMREELKKEEELLVTVYELEKEVVARGKEKKKEVKKDTDEERAWKRREREQREMWYRDHQNDPSYKDIYAD